MAENERAIPDTPEGLVLVLSESTRSMRLGAFESAIESRITCTWCEETTLIGPAEHLPRIAEGASWNLDDGGYVICSGCSDEAGRFMEEDGDR